MVLRALCLAALFGAAACDIYSTDCPDAYERSSCGTCKEIGKPSDCPQTSSSPPSSTTPTPDDDAGRRFDAGDGATDASIDTNADAGDAN